MSSTNEFALVKELITILASDDDVDLLEKGRNALNISIELQAKQKTELNEQVRRLAKAGKEAETLASQDDNTLSKTLDTLNLDTKTASTDIKNIESEISELGNEIATKREGKKKLEEKREKVELETDEVLPKTKYNFKLYTNISHIRWDYDCEDDQIKGFVACLNDVKPFSLNTKQNSKFFATNYLWDLVSSQAD